MKLSVTIVLMIMSFAVIAQNKSVDKTLGETKVTIKLDHETLEALFHKIEAQTSFIFAWPPDEVAAVRDVTLEEGTRTVKETLELVFANTTLSFRQQRNSVIIFDKAKDAPKGNRQGSIKGTVKDSKGEPLPGVTVMLKGTTTGTTSDAEGNFLIDANSDDILVLSAIGNKTQEQRVDNRTVIDVVMEDDVNKLDEVVVHAGYYDVKQRESTASIGKVTSEVISKQPVTNPLGALQGRIPGVFIQQTTGIPGGAFKIEIRGRNSLRRDGQNPIGNDPLYIIDGVPFSMESVSYSGNSSTFGGTTSPLTGINPSDIESIEILKDADATAIYGSRGSNGVVLIATKRGKQGRTHVSVDFYTGSGWAPKVEMLNTPQYLKLRRAGFALDGLEPSTDPVQENLFAPELLLWDSTRHTNWQDVLIGKTAKTNSLQANLSGGSESTQFLFGIGYRSETPVFPGNFKYEKLSTHLSVTHASPGKKFTATLTFSGTIDNNDQTAYDATNRSRTLAPNAPEVYNDDGTLNWENSTWENPLAYLVTRYEARVGTLVTNAVLGYEILPGLKIKTSAGYTTLESKELRILPSTRFDPAKGQNSSTSGVTDARGSNQSWIIEPQLAWDKRIFKGQLSMLAGTTFQEQRLEKVAIGYSNFPSNTLLYNLASAVDRVQAEYAKSLYRYTAVFGRVNYNWDGKYIVNLTARRDGSSRFGPGKKFATFGAAGVAWVFTNEKFFTEHAERSRSISFGKLRGSFGITGNDQIGNYQYFDTYQTISGYGSQYQGITSLTPARLFNRDFQWETNQKLEGALELGFLNDRIFLTTAYFGNRSSNQLVLYTLPYLTGFNGILTNLDATIQNTGLEVELSTINFKKDNFSWTTSFNITVPRNKLVEYRDLESSTYRNTYVVGQSIYLRNRYESTGVDPQTGLWTFSDLNGDDQVTDSDMQKKMFIGQEFFGGFNNSLTWKGWSLDIFFQFVKQTGFNYWAEGAMLGDRYNHPAFVLESDIWQQPGDEATIQRPATAANAEARAAYLKYVYSDASVSDASFIRLKNLALSYRFPERWTKNLVCRMYIQGQNLFVISPYKWFDPESQGSNMPPLRMLTMGINVTL